MSRTRSTYNEEKENAIFAKRLRGLFEERRKTNQSLADFITKETGESVTRQAVGQWCKGNSCPAFKTMPIIAKFFDVSTDYLYGLSDQQTNDKTLAAVADYMTLSDTTLMTIKDKLNYTHVFDENGNRIKKELSENYKKNLKFVFEKIVSDNNFWDIVFYCCCLLEDSQLIYSLNKNTSTAAILQICNSLNLEPEDVFKYAQSIPAPNDNYYDKSDLDRYEIFKTIEEISNLFDFRKHIPNISPQALCKILKINDQTICEIKKKKAGD